MKKTLLILAAIVFAVTACEKQTYVDGTYEATFDEPHFGWTEYLTFELTGDEISNVDFDAVNADGDLKSTDEAYNENMFTDSAYVARMEAAGKAPTKPETYMPQIESALSNATIVPEFEPVDIVSGATSSSVNANALMEAALDMAADGDGNEIVISYPEE